MNAYNNRDFEIHFHSFCNDHAILLQFALVTYNSTIFVNDV